MKKRLTDDEVMDYTYNKLFGDLDGIESGSMFSDSKDAVSGVADNAGSTGLSGIDISITPKMAGAQEGGRKDDIKGTDEEDEDKLKGIGDISPLMSQLHGKR